MKVKNIGLADLDDRPLVPQGTTESLTIAKALLNAALSPNQNPNASKDGKDTLERYEFALAVNKTMDDQYFDIDAAFWAKLQVDMLRIYPVWVCGQVMKHIDSAKTEEAAHPTVTAGTAPANA